jgi:hypothetical protein
MEKQSFKDKRREWLRRYVPAEIIGTITALTGAWLVYAQSHSYLAATAAGWVGEGIGFFGYFITLELVANNQRYKDQPFFKRASLALATASTNLIVEFLPAELLDNFIVRPYLMYLLPHYIHPYPVGFLVGKFSADILFYALAIVGYEARKRWLKR